VGRELPEGVVCHDCQQHTQSNGHIRHHAICHIILYIHTHSLTPSLPLIHSLLSLATPPLTPSLIIIMSARSTSNESSSTSLQSPRNKKSKPPTSASSSSSSSSSHTVPIIYNYQNYPQSEAEKEEKKVVGGYDLHLKLLMLGDSGVGKSSLVLQYANEEFTTNFVTTIGIDYKIKLLESGKHKVKLQIWDTVSV
jgi:hypothetical protein